MSLYIHIPFCSHRCAYCDFYSMSSFSEREQEGYVQRIIDDFSYFKSVYNLDKIDTFYIGGGTPTVLNKEMLSKLLFFFSDVATHSREFTLEANPEDISEDLLKIISNSKVDRLSLGFQSFQNDTLRYIGRSRGSREEYLKTLSLLKQFWSKKLSGDLIVGVANQKLDNIQQDIQLLSENGFNHLSLYALQNEENTSFYQWVNNGLREEMDSQESLAQQDKLNAFLYDLSYEHYEVSNYAKNDEISLHNTHYWNMDSYLGLGSSAVSTLKVNNQFIRLTGKLLKHYNTGPEQAYEKEVISKKDFLIEQFIMGLRLVSGFDISNLVDKKISIEALVSTVNKNGEYLVLEKTNLKLTKKGYSIMNKVLVSIMEYLDSLNEINA